MRPMPEHIAFGVYAYIGVSKMTENFSTPSMTQETLDLKILIQVKLAGTCPLNRVKPNIS